MTPAPGRVALHVLSSGSRGNLLCLESGATRILIDAGLSARMTEGMLRARRIDPAGLAGILVTHEHIDHVRGVALLARRHRLRVWASERVWEGPGEAWEVERAHSFRPGVPFSVGGLSIEPFAISHDTVDPVGFAVTTPKGRIGVATDLGYASRGVRENLSGCRALLLESNHDEGMLRHGPYPAHLKRRIAGEKGHLSNRQSADLLAELVHPGLTLVVLAHLSEENNTPELALQGASRILGDLPHPVRLTVGRPLDALEPLLLT